MATLDTGLTEGASVFLDVGSGRLMACSVIAFLGSAVLVLPTAPPTEAERDWILSGTTDLLWDRGNHLEAMPGSVREVGQALAVHVIDAPSLGQRRWWSRAAIALNARAVPLSSRLSPTETKTADVSAGGVRLVRPPDMRPWPRYELTLDGEGLAAAVVVEAVPARVVATHLSLRFTRIEEEDRRTLAQLVLDRLTRPGAPGVGRSGS